MDDQRVDGVLAKLAESSDLQKVIQASGLPPEEIMRLLRLPGGRRRLRAWQSLARVHRRLLADQYSPFAISQLAGLLGDEKPEVRLKGALAILAAVREKSRERKVRGKAETKPVLDVPMLDGTATAELLEAVSEVLERRREPPEGPSHSRED